MTTKQQYLIEIVRELGIKNFAPRAFLCQLTHFQRIVKEKSIYAQPISETGAGVSLGKAYQTTAQKSRWLANQRAKNFRFPFGCNRLLWHYLHRTKRKLYC